MIKIVGLGPGAKEALTVGTMDILKNESRIYFRTEVHPTVEYIKDIGIKFETYDNYYEKSQNFDDLYRDIAEDIISKHEEYGDLVYAVPGHPLVAEKSVNILLELCKDKKIKVKIIPAVSFVDAMMEALKIDPIQGIKIIDAFDIKNQILDKRLGTIITQVYNKFIASEVKLALLDYYDDETEIYFVRAAGIEGLESIRKIHIYEIDRQEDIDYLTSLYVPKNLNSNAKDFYDLIKIVDILRSENGCPWDREQTHESLKRELIEESYEVVEAIDNKDEDNLIEELGDVLLHVVFHAAIGKEEGYFNEKDILKGICEKMIARHPHVFGNDKVENSKDVIDKWEKIKKKEKGLKTYTEELKHVAKSLPSLIRAEKVQKKAAEVGFDWDKVELVMDKVNEELDELKDVYKCKNRVRILEEIGDLIFTMVNIARFLDIDPENALNYTIDKFIKRFEYIEKQTKKNGNIIEKTTLEEMDKLWKQSKTI